MKKFIITCLASTCLLFLTSCEPDEGNYQNDFAGEMKTAPCGFRYKIIEIEGKRFIAYKTAYDVWEVTLLDGNSIHQAEKE